MFSIFRLPTIIPRQCSAFIRQHALYRESPTAFSLLRHFHPSTPASGTLNQATRRKHVKKAKPCKSPLLEGNTQRKGVVGQIFIMKPKKPNSAKRKVARVKLSTGKSVHAYIAGEGHTLQEHSVVVVRGGRTQDLPGVRFVHATVYGFD